jgi:hypothetical protein
MPVEGATPPGSAPLGAGPGAESGRADVTAGWAAVATSTPAVHTGSAYLVYVGLDEAGNPRPVPPVVPETRKDRQRYREAEIRRQTRLARREAILRLREQEPDEG